MSTGVYLDWIIVCVVWCVQITYNSINKDEADSVVTRWWCHGLLQWINLILLSNVNLLLSDYIFKSVYLIHFELHVFVNDRGVGHWCFPVIYFYRFFVRPVNTCMSESCLISLHANVVTLLYWNTLFVFWCSPNQTITCCN
jgi:hypothetical protein